MLSVTLGSRSVAVAVLLIEPVSQVSLPVLAIDELLPTLPSSATFAVTVKVIVLRVSALAFLTVPKFAERVRVPAS